jgi:MFS family permease
MRWWSAANLVSNVGTWLQMTAQNLLVLHVTHSAAMTGLSIAAQAAPGLLLGPFGGAVVDSWPRRRVAAVSQAALALVAFLTAALIVTGHLGVGALLALAAVTGLVATIDGPACALLGNDLVPERDVPSAIALGSVISSAGRLIGVALAGALITLAGPAAAYAGNGLSFLCVTAVIPFLRPYRHAPADGAPAPAGPPASRGTTGPPQAPAPAPVSGRTPVLAAASAPASGTAPGRPDAGAPARSRSGTRDGLRYFRRSPRLMRLAWITGLSSVFGRNYTLTLAVLVTGPLHQGAGAFGMVSTALAAGGVAGAVLAGRLRRPSVRLVGVLAAAGALFQSAAGLAPSLAMLTVLVVPMAIAEAVSDTAVASVLQTHPPADMRGRVLGVWRSAGTVWGLAGPPALGLMLQYAGARGALVAGGLVVVAGIAAGAARSARREGAPELPSPRARGLALPEASPTPSPGV